MFQRWGLQSELEVSLPYTSTEETVPSKSIDKTIPSFSSDDSLIDGEDSLMSIYEINETILHYDLPEAQNEIADLRTLKLRVWMILTFFLPMLDDGL